MKTIKIFLASSEELDYDRMAFGNLVRRLDDMYEKRGIRIKLFEWEDYDSAYNDKRKQDEYNEYVKQSDIFLALFHKKAGQFTIEEFDKASEQFKTTASPKVYTYCKDLKPGDEESPELKEFKERLFNEMGHYWCRYDNRESLQFQFVMQLQLVESNRMDDVKVEDGVVTINGLPVAKMENLKFAACNDKYQEMSEKLASFPEQIAKSRLRSERYPEDEDLRDELQQKLNEFNQLKKEFAELQQNFFDTAKRVVQLQGEHITNRLRDAINAFNEGRVHDCNLILDIAKEDARRDYDDFKQSIEIAEVKRQNVISHITEKLFHASSILADAIIPIEERIQRADELYEEAYNMADDKHVNYPTEKFIDLLFKYSSFLSYYAYYDKALGAYNRLLKLCKDFYGKEHPVTAVFYTQIGNVHSEIGNDYKAYEYYKQALDIQEEVLGKEHPDTAITYHNIGSICSNNGYYNDALAYHMKALFIFNKVLEKEDLRKAASYASIGNDRFHLGYCENALDCYQKALDIRERLLGKEHPDIADIYIGIGNIYLNLKDYNKALKFHQQALNIKERCLGKQRIDIASSYNTIGLIYSNIGDNEKALENYQQGLNIYERVLGKEDLLTAESYYYIGNISCDIKNYDKALDFYKNALDIRERLLGISHPETMFLYNELAWTYHLMGKYEEALPWAERAISVEPSDPAVIDTIATVYQGLGRYNEAMKQFKLCLKLRKEQNQKKEKIHETEVKIAELKDLMK